MGAIDNAAAVLAAEDGAERFWEDAYPSSRTRAS